MRLTDPTDLLRSVSSQRYEDLLKACRTGVARRKLAPRPSKSANGSNDGVADPVAYVEPSLAQPLAHSEGMVSDREPKRLGSGQRNAISSRIYKLGDFVDTDAVRLHLNTWVRWYQTISNQSCADHTRFLYPTKPYR